MKRIIMAAILTTGMVTPALAETELEAALANGGKQLTADQIAARIVGKTVTAALGEKRFLFHYSNDNVLSGRLLDGDWSDTGYYGITDDDRVCLSMTNDNHRLRCLVLVEQGGTIRKYNSDGEATFELLEVRDGKLF
jgi:hypothetical protein